VIYCGNVCGKKLRENIQGTFARVSEQGSFIAQYVWVHRDMPWLYPGSRRPYKWHLVLRKLLDIRKTKRKALDSKAINSGFGYPLIFTDNSTWPYRHTTITGFVGQTHRNVDMYLSQYSASKPVLDKSKYLSTPLIPQISSEKLCYKLEHTHITRWAHTHITRWSHALTHSHT
jgi:hypothetical protein